jgi:aspartate/methionine/tyrosine aminotransferase
MPALSKRTEYFTDSVIRRMTRISNTCGAVNLSQGFPDFDPPIELKKSLEKVASGSIHQYSVTWGAQNFREKVNHFIRLHFAKNIDTLSEALNRLESLHLKVKGRL